MNESTALAVATPQHLGSLGIWANFEAFDQGQRMAAALAGSTLLPDCYRADKAGGKQALSNCLMLLSLAQRLQMDPVLVAQNMSPIQGRPAFSSPFLIALINRSGLFGPLQFHHSGEGDDRQCYVSAQDLRTGTELKGMAVSVRMAKDLGWWGRKDSQWPKNTDQLLAYRAAGWFQRLHCPELLLGFATREEVVDAVIDLDPEPAPVMAAAAVEPEPEPEPEPEATAKAADEPSPSQQRCASALRGIQQLTTPTALANSRRKADALLRNGEITPEDHCQIVEAIDVREAELSQPVGVQGD